MKKTIVALMIVSFLAVEEVRCNKTTPSACQMPQCLPVLASYLQIQASLLQSIKSDLETTKQQLQQSIGQWPPGHYCILANGSCPAGFTRSSGYMRAVEMYSHTSQYLTTATFGSSSIQCHGKCGRNGHWVADLFIAACCK